MEVLDFGDAAPVPPEGLLEFKGSWGYRCPEMRRFERYGTPADVFSLGVVGHELFEQDHLQHMLILDPKSLVESMKPSPKTCCDMPLCNSLIVFEGHQAILYFFLCSISVVKKNILQLQNGFATRPHLYFEEFKPYEV